MPNALMDHAPAYTNDQPVACLLHGDFHVMTAACWSVTADWYFAHQHVPPAEQQDDYMAAVERKMLDDIARGRAS